MAVTGPQRRGRAPLSSILADLTRDLGEGVWTVGAQLDKAPPPKGKADWGSVKLFSCLTGFGVGATPARLWGPKNLTAPGT